MMENQHILCFANDWNHDPTSKHQIMKILSDRNVVLWVNSIGMRNPSLKGADIRRIILKIILRLRGVEQAKKHLHVMTPIVIPFHKFSTIRRINRFLLIKQIKYYIEKLKLQNLQLWTFIPTMADIVGRLGEKKVIYYCVDDWSKFSFIDEKMICQMESDLIEKADVVFASARVLYEKSKKLNPNTYLMLHGVDYEHFSRALNQALSIPKDIQIIPKPIIGFFGLIHEWIDLNLIEKMAQEKPEWSIVMIGKISTDINPLGKYKNIFFLGPKKYEDLPAYCKAMGVAIIPFKVNELTKSVNPIKLREYLAAGLPVVSVNLPEVQTYGNFVKMSNNADEFIVNVQNCLREATKSEKARRSFSVSQEDWSVKVDNISKILSFRLRKDIQRKEHVVA